AAAVSGQHVTGMTPGYRSLNHFLDSECNDTKILSRECNDIKRTDEWRRLPLSARRNLDPLDWARVNETFREADLRVNKSIGVDRGLGAALMAKLWGKPFSDERDQRAEPDANAQRKGQISRQLKAELQEVIPDGNN